MNKKHTKFWIITHIAAWAMLIVTVAGAIVGAMSVVGIF